MSKDVLAAAIGATFFGACDRHRHHLPGERHYSPDEPGIHFADPYGLETYVLRGVK